MQDRAKEYLYTAASTTYSYLSTLPSLFYKSRTSSAPSIASNQLPTKKTARKRSTFQNNITASLAIPDTPKKQIAFNKSEGFFSGIFSAITSLASPLSTKIAITSSTYSTTPISQQIMALEKQIQQLTELERDTKLDDLLLQEVNLLEHEIREHARRRVDLFFYLLIAVYNTKNIVSKDKTVKQHGQGNKEINTHGCHPSLFPSVKFSQPPSSLFFAVKPISFKGTFFEEALNMVDELPAPVNAFDGHLEGRFEQTRYVDACLDIANLVSQGTIDPIIGMNQFFLKMNAFFQRFKEKHLDKGKSNIKKSNQQIWEYEKEGTFEAANDDFTLKYEYLYMMLRLNKHEIRACYYVPGVGSAILARNYRLIQEELLSPKVKPTVAKPTSKK